LTLRLYKGSAAVVARSSLYSLYDEDLVTFEDGKTPYDQRDAAGFIRLTRCGCACSASAGRS